MDATHLAEFHQVEGVVADRDLTLADLIGMSHYICPYTILKLLGVQIYRFHESLLQ